MTKAEKLKFTEAEAHEWPICPWCKKEIKEIKFKQRGWLSSTTAFWCPYCRSLLGTATSFNG